MKNGPYELIVPPPDYPGKRYRGRYAYEHIVVFWKTHGRLPKEGHVVHHKNEHKRDNGPGNLEEKPEGLHKAEHNEVESLRVTCGWCKKKFKLKPSKANTRKKQSKSGLMFCSKAHQVRHQFLTYGHPKTGQKMACRPEKIILR